MGSAEGDPLNAGRAHVSLGMGPDADVWLARCERALAGFARLTEAAQQVSDDPDVEFAPPEGYNTMAAVQALVDILAQLGLVDRQQFAALMIRHSVEILEAELRKDQQQIREEYGVNVPLGSTTRPQG